MVPAVILTPFWGWTSRRPKPTFIRWSKALHLLTLAETQNSKKRRNLVCEMHFGVAKDKIWLGGQSGPILMGGGRDCGGEHGATAAMGGSGLERDRGCDRRPSGDRRTGDQQWRARASLDPGLDVVEPRGSEPAGRTSKAMSTWTTLCLELPWKLKSAYSQSQKRRKLSGWQDFCRKNFPDKTRKLHHFSNSRQIRVKSVFANFKHNNGPNMLHRVHL